jgi:hypothetical protein
MQTHYASNAAPIIPDPQTRESASANVLRHVPSGTYFARLKRGGKLIRQRHWHGFERGE